MNERKQWQGDWDRFEEIAQAWEDMNSRLGDFGIADVMAKTDSYKAYDTRYPFDTMLKWEDNIDLSDPTIQIQAVQISVEDEVSDRLEIERLVANLTPKQKLIFEALRDGENSVQIEIEQGYNTNNAVRWHKHQIKKKYNSILADKYEQCFEFVCRECGNIFDGQEIESICPSCDSKDTLFLRSYTKPIIDV